MDIVSTMLGTRQRLDERTSLQLILHDPSSLRNMPTRGY